MNLNTKSLNGYKTYIIAVALICWAVGGFIAGKVDVNAAMQGILVALAMMGIRHGVSLQKQAE